MYDRETTPKAEPDVQHAPAAAEPAVAAEPGAPAAAPDQAPLARKEHRLAEFIGDMKAVAAQLSPQFAELGLSFRYQILMAIAMNEAAPQDPANAKSFDGGLGLMQITPDRRTGHLEPEVARAIDWDNSADLETNLQRSNWRNARASLLAGARVLLAKARLLHAHVAKMWEHLDDAQRWRAVAFAYNAGEEAAAKALEQGGGDAKMVSHWRDKQGQLRENHFAADFDANMTYVEAGETAQDGAASPATSAPAAHPGGRDALGHKEDVLAPFYKEMEQVAAEIAPRFAPLGLHFRPQILLATAMQEAAPKDPLTHRSFDDGLGIMQITPYRGKLDPDVARAIGWDNGKGIEHNIKNSKWRSAKPNLTAGALTMLAKARAIKAGAAKVWAEMDEPHRWRAVMYAYNAGESSAIHALKAGGPNAPMISSFRNKHGKRVHHDYTQELQARASYVDTHDPFADAAGSPGLPGQEAGGADDGTQLA